MSGLVSRFQVWKYPGTLILSNFLSHPVLNPLATQRISPSFWPEKLSLRKSLPRDVRSRRWGIIKHNIKVFKWVTYSTCNSEYLTISTPLFIYSPLAVSVIISINGNMVLLGITCPGLIFNNVKWTNIWSTLCYTLRLISHTCHILFLVIRVCVQYPSLHVRQRHRTFQTQD